MPSPSMSQFQSQTPALAAPGPSFPNPSQYPTAAPVERSVVADRAPGPPAAQEPTYDLEDDIVLPPQPPPPAHNPSSKSGAIASPFGQRANAYKSGAVQSPFESPYAPKSPSASAAQFAAMGAPAQPSALSALMEETLDVSQDPSLVRTQVEVHVDDGLDDFGDMGELAAPSGAAMHDGLDPNSTELFSKDRLKVDPQKTSEEAFELSDPMAEAGELFDFSGADANVQAAGALLTSPPQTSGGLLDDDAALDAFMAAPLAPPKSHHDEDSSSSTLLPPGAGDSLPMSARVGALAEILEAEGKISDAALLYEVQAYLASIDR
jgi:hypothetical protein